MSGLFLRLTLGTAVLLGAALANGDAARSFELTCRSSGDGATTCPFGFEAAGVALTAQLSSAACRRGTNWTGSARSVTVAAGCSGRFDVTMPRARPRIVILTDIGQDPDDVQSLVRTLLYANDVSIEGIVPTYRPGNRPVGSDIVRAVLNAYEKDLPQLRQHDIRYPAADLLRSRLKPGLPTNERIGAGQDSAGSDHIVRVVDAGEEPVWILVWGGSRELAQAIHKVRTTRSAKAFAAFQKKLRVYAIGWSQYSPEPADYLADNAKDMFWIASSSYDGTRSATFRGMYLLGDTSMQDRAWSERHITSRGHLGAAYPLFTTEDGLKEGDTPSLLHVLPIGLNDPQRPEEGGWGGRYAIEPRYARLSKNLHTSREVADRLDGALDRRASVARWRPAFQADFAARAAWLELPYAEANHPPDVRIAGAANRTVRPGDVVTLDATASGDPDGDRLSYRWWVYREAGSFAGDLRLADDDTALARLTAPSVDSAQSISVVLEVKDSGRPALTRYGRVRLTVAP